MKFKKNEPYTPNYPKYIYQILKYTEAETKKRVFRKKAENYDRSIWFFIF